MPRETAARASIMRAARAGSRPGSAARSTSRPSSSSAHECRGERQGGLAIGVDRAGAAVESRRDHHHRPRLRRQRARRSGCGRRSRRCRRGACICRPSCRSAGSISRRRQPADRAVVARQDSLSGAVPEDIRVLTRDSTPSIRRARAIYCATLRPRDAERRQIESRIGVTRPGGIDVTTSSRCTRSRCPGLLIASPCSSLGLLVVAFTVGRYPVGLADSADVLIVAKLTGRAGEHRRRRGERHPAGARAARARGGAGRRGAGGRRHRVPGPVPQSAGLAGYSRRLVGRGARRGARHLLLARRLRASRPSPSSAD